MYRLDKLSNSPYSSSLSGEALRLREMRMLARLKLAGKTDSEITQVITSENSFQYNVRSKYTKKVLRYGLERLKALDSKDLVKVVAEGSLDDAKLVCLYSAMLTNRILWEFMVCVIGNKYSSFDTLYVYDAEKFLKQTREQNPKTVTWSDSTLSAIAKSIRSFLYDAGILDKKTKRLKELFVPQVLVDAIEKLNTPQVFNAFNYFKKQ